MSGSVEKHYRAGGLHHYRPIVGGDRVVVDIGQAVTGGVKRGAAVVIHIALFIAVHIFDESRKRARPAGFEA